MVYSAAPIVNQTRIHRCTLNRVNWVRICTPADNTPPECPPEGRIWLMAGLRLNVVPVNRSKDRTEPCSTSVRLARFGAITGPIAPFGPPFPSKRVNLCAGA
jgi:hypothetical protein